MFMDHGIFYSQKLDGELSRKAVNMVWYLFLKLINNEWERQSEALKWELSSAFLSRPVSVAEGGNNKLKTAVIMSQCGTLFSRNFVSFSHTSSLKCVYTPLQLPQISVKRLSQSMNNHNFCLCLGRELCWMCPGSSKRSSPNTPWALGVFWWININQKWLFVEQGSLFYLQDTALTVSE